MECKCTFNAKKEYQFRAKKLLPEETTFRVADEYNRNIDLLHRFQKKRNFFTISKFQNCMNLMWTYCLD